MGTSNEVAIDGPILGIHPFASCYPTAFGYPSMATHGSQFPIQVKERPTYFATDLEERSWRDIVHNGALLGDLVEGELTDLMDDLQQACFGLWSIP